MFYWMLESKHPLVLIGLPGLVLFVLGIQLSGNVIDQFKELNSTSLGVTLATVAVTLVGLFALMTAILLWIMEKQVASLHHQVETEGEVA
jgi:predicted transporter